jgi:ABC-type antimicrobial peptide transport system permease subunit
VAPQVRRVVSALDPHLPVRGLTTLQREIARKIRGERLLSLLTGSFAVLATLLSAVGLYGVLAYDVARRTREIGIRMALGAKAAQVRGLVLRQVAAMLAIGAAAGLAAAVATARVVRSVLFGTAPLDPVVYGAALAMVTGMALLAAFVPARRASTVDPMVALRDE